MASSIAVKHAAQVSWLYGKRRQEVEDAIDNAILGAEARGRVKGLNEAIGIVQSNTHTYEADRDSWDYANPEAVIEEIVTARDTKE